MDSTRTLAWASLLVTIAGLGLNLFATYGDPSGIPDTLKPALALFGAVLVVIGLLGLALIAAAWLVRRRSARQRVLAAYPEPPPTRQHQGRGDGSGDQYQAGRDIHVDNRFSRESRGDTRPLLQVTKRGQVTRDEGDTVAWFPEVRVVNRDPHRHLSAQVCARTYNDCGDETSSYPHSPPPQRERRRGMLPATVKLREGDKVEGAARFPLDHEGRKRDLWIVLVDTVTDVELAREWAPIDRGE